MASGSQNMTTFKAKGLTSIANTVDTSNFIFLKSTAFTADQLGNTVSLSLNVAAVTGAAMTNHSLFLNAGIGSGLGTPFQLQIPDSSHLYIYKRWYTSGAWSGWSKVSAGHADLLTTARAINGTNFDGSADITTANWGTSRTLTVGATGKSVNGSGNVSWSMNEIMGSSDSSKFYRGDKTWSNTVTGGLGAAYLGVTNTSPTNGYGISLYNGATAGAPDYGIMFQGTGTFGKHGAVTSDWATYFTMNNNAARGWIFRRGTTNVASISGGGTCTLDGGLEIKGHIAGDGGTTGHGLYSGGAYHNAYNNIILQGDSTSGSSGIAFVSSKGTATINQPSDRAFIQFHAYGVTTYTGEGTAPTLATSGEANVLVIGVGNDATDTIRLQTPGRTGLLHQVAASAYVIPDTNNTTGSVGGTTTPVYIDGGIIKTCTAYASASVNYATSSGSSGSCTGNAATATNADKVDNYHAADLWRKDGGTWNGNANIACTPTANNQEYSFDLGNAYTGTYWHVWSGKNSASILQCYNDTRYVYVPVHLAVGGYDNTSYALSTNSFICNSWVRTKGSTGWYNEDHGGGWYMTDNKWNRSYGSKPVLIDIGTNNTYGIGGHRLALGLSGGSHTSILLKGGDAMYGFCVNNDGNWYFGHRTSKSFESTSGDVYLLYGNSTTFYPYTDNSINLGTSNHRWKTCYAVNFHGALTGNVTGNCSGSSGSCTGNAATATEGKYFMNRGGSTVTIADSSWAIQITPSGHTNRATVFSQNWKQSGLTYTPSGGSAKAVSDTADFKLWLSSSNTSNALQLNMQIDGRIYALDGFQGTLTGNCTGSSGSCTGNAATATTATNANYLISNTRMDYGWNGINYFNLSAARSTAVKNNQTPYSSATWTHILRFNHGNKAGYYTDLAIPFNGNSVWYRRIANGALQNATYDSNTGWVELLDAINYTSYTVTKTGSGASGTWGINITGSAGSVAWGHVSSKPATATRWPSWSEVTSKPTIPFIVSKARVGGTSTTVDLAWTIDAGEPFGFIVVANSWVGMQNNGSLTLITGLQRGTSYGNAQNIFKGTYGPSVSYNNSNGKVTITFYNGDGGFYSILRLYGSDAI